MSAFQDNSLKRPLIDTSSEVKIPKGKCMDSAAKYTGEKDLTDMDFADREMSIDFGATPSLQMKSTQATDFNLGLDRKQSMDNQSQMSFQS